MASSRDLADDLRGASELRPDVDAAEVSRFVDGVVRSHPVVGLAVGVVGGGGPVGFESRGLADIPSRRPITPDTVVRIASITKTFTAVAVMQLWEEGLVDLDAPANDYLRAYELVPDRPEWRPATLRDLLTHTAGLAEVAHPAGVVLPDFGESVAAGTDVPSPAAFYGGGLGVHAEPGTRFVYNNHGPTTLGQVVEDVSGMPLHRYFRERIFDPLGMDDSDLLRSEGVEAHRATGYEIGSRGVEAVQERDMVTAGAASVYSTPADMARYLTALLGGDGSHGRSILRPETVTMMFEPAYRPDPRIPGMGLGFFRYRLGDRSVVGHQGTHPGFHSHILLSPDHGIGVMAFTNGARQADFWLPSETTRLLGRLVGASGGGGDGPQRPELWADLSGWYRLSARLTDVRLRGMMGAGMEVFVRNGEPMLRFLTPIPALAGGFPLIPDDAADPYVFRIEPLGPGYEPMRVVFGQDDRGATNRLHFEMMPLSLDKQPAASNPRRWAMGAAGALGAGAVLTAIRAVRA